jgi:CspA family cold shock protein
MADGTVKWFNAARGFGMIVPDDRTPDVFVHFSSIEGAGHRDLIENQRVTFDVVSGIKGPRSIRVRPLDSHDRQAPPSHSPPGPLGGEDTD